MNELEQQPEPTSEKDKLNESIDKLRDWLQKKNFDLYFGAFEDIADSSERSITIDNRKKLENQLYVLLHECGHIIVNNNQNYSSKFPYMMRANKRGTRNKRLENCYKYRVEQISEEIDAWRAGRDLAKRLSIPVNDENFHDLMTKKVYTYVIY
jgi:hypothetical protein